MLIDEGPAGIFAKTRRGLTEVVVIGTQSSSIRTLVVMLTMVITSLNMVGMMMAGAVVHLFNNYYYG